MISLNWYLRGSLALILCLTLLVVVTYGSFLLLPAQLHYHIEEKYLFSIEEGNAAVNLGILIPKSGPYQEVKNIKISWDGFQERENRPYVELIKLSGVLSDGEDQEAIVSYDVILPKGKVTWEAPVEEFQYLPQHGIESDHPRIKEQASQITTGSALEDVYRIFNYTSNYLIYSLGERNCTSSSALSAFMTQTGVCIEFARLMVAFSRASEIPAQMVSGIALPDLVIFGTSQTRNWEHPGESHAWVEFNTEGAWTMADPTVGSGFLKRLHFGRNDGHYLSYGEFEQEGKAYVEMQRWVTNQGNIIGSEHGSFKFVASADSNQVSITPSLYIRKGWDGCWANTLVSLILTTVILCKLRNRFIQRPSDSTPGEDP
ncbi:transglutaminase family protein [Chloroflexota bacterium]